MNINFSGNYFLPAGGQLINNGDCQITKQGHGQGAGDRRGCHHQHICLSRLFQEFATLQHSKAMLLINDHELQIFKMDLTLDQGVSTNSHMVIALFQGLA